ncbi:hypothetical protein CMI44_02105 [Candidatus Pacearchaeota archaeon]|jgi:hypothetical protein|nr:hypothetical protein [Candidatus Pacearchaeota archaeon]|tara:strand:- start:828 stop:1388 length:561 start_codon:yes stop_codon:yes gene_type:complete
MQEVENILRIFEEVRVAINEEKISKLRQLSDQTNNTASRTQDPDNIAVAVIIYSLGKILEREQYRSYQGWKKFYKNMLIYIDKIINAMKNNRETEVSGTLKLMRGEIENISGKLRGYARDVFRKAQINKASKIYEHGVSLEKTAKLLGITMFELAGYAGQKQDSYEPELHEKSVKQRIKLAMEMFE